MQYPSTPQDGLVLCEGDPNEWSVGITKVTYERLMREEDGMDLCSLWMFFAYTCRWQKTNQARASISYVCKGTHWGEAKVQRLKNRLVELGLIQNVQKRDEEGKVSGWYVKVLHLAKAASRSSESEDVDQILGFAGSCENEVQILKDSKVKYSRTSSAPNGSSSKESWRDSFRKGVDEAGSVSLPDDASQELRESWERWHEYRSSRALESPNKSSALGWTKKAAEAEARNIARYLPSLGELLIIGQIDSAISGNWQGLNLNKVRPPNASSSPSNGSHYPSQRLNPNMCS